MDDQKIELEIIHTGGGCTALYAHNPARNLCILITDGNLNYPEEGGAWEVGIYKGDYIADDDINCLSYFSEVELGQYSARAGADMLKLIFID